MSEKQLETLKTMIAMADFMSNCDFAANMEDSTRNFAEFFFVNLTDIYNTVKKEAAL